MELHSQASYPTSQAGHNYFHWGGTLTAIFLLLLNHTGRRSFIQTSLLVVYIFASLPIVLFNILRGQFGAWVAFLAVAAHLFFPEGFPASRFLLFVVAPSWVAHALRNNTVACISCLVIGVCLLIEQIPGTGVRGFHKLSYVVGISLLLIFPILDLWKGS